MQAIGFKGHFEPPPGFDCVAHLEMRIAEFKMGAELARAVPNMPHSVINWLDHRAAELENERNQRAKR